MAKGTKLTVAALGTLLSVLAFYEGVEYTSYKDTNSYAICSGWTHGVKPGDTATPEQCEELTLEAVRQADRVISTYLPDFPDSPEMRAAYISFIYNVGIGGRGVKDGFVYLRSGEHSTMFKLIRDGKYEQACHELPKWNKAGGKILGGLVKRRETEKEMCLEGLRNYIDRRNRDRVEDSRLAFVSHDIESGKEYCYGARELDIEIPRLGTGFSG